MVFEQLVDALPTVRGCRGRPRRWPHKLHADKGYDIARCRAHLRKLSITARIARRGIERNDRLGRHRWVVERTHAWLAAFGKLRTRFERRIDSYVALLSLACCLICVRHLAPFCSPLLFRQHARPSRRILTMLILLLDDFNLTEEAEPPPYRWLNRSPTPCAPRSSQVICRPASG